MPEQVLQTLTLTTGLIEVFCFHVQVCSKVTKKCLYSNTRGHLEADVS